MLWKNENGRLEAFNFILCVYVFVYVLCWVFSTFLDKHKNSIIKINSINEHHMLLSIFILIGMPFMIRAFGNKQKNNRLNYLYFRLDKYCIAYLFSFTFFHPKQGEEH